MSPELRKIHDQFVDKMGFLSSLLGFNRLVGQIYGTLYLNPQPQNLNDIMTNLAVSKASISIHIRELEKWGGCQKVWIKGDRRDFYEAEVDFRKIINKRFIDAVQRRLGILGEMSDEPQKEITSYMAGLSKEDKELAKFYQSRLGKIHRTRKKMDILLKTVNKLI